MRGLTHRDALGKRKGSESEILGFGPWSFYVLKNRSEFSSKKRTPVYQSGPKVVQNARQNRPILPTFQPHAPVRRLARRATGLPVLPVAQRGLVIIPRTKDQNQGFSPSPPPPLLSASRCANPFARTSLQAHKNPPIPYHTHNDPRDLAKFPTLPTFPRTFQLSTCSRTLPSLPLPKPRFRTPRGASFPNVT